MYFVFFALVQFANAYHSGWVDRAQADEVRVALDRYFAICGQYPDQLAQLFESTTKSQDCPSGTGEVPMKDTATNRDTVAKLTYMPFGYQDYELSVRLFWTRDFDML